MAERREKYLQSPADEHFPSSSICKTCPLLKSHSQKRMESDLNSDLPDSKAWLKKKLPYFTTFLLDVLDRTSEYFWKIGSLFSSSMPFLF